MSGGSFNYLCFQDDSDLLEGSHDKDIESMRDRLIELGHDDAAIETERLLLTLRQSRVRVSAAIQRLNKIWKAIEWYDSADWGPERIYDAMAEYRGEEEV